MSFPVDAARALTIVASTSDRITRRCPMDKLGWLYMPMLDTRFPSYAPQPSSSCHAHLPSGILPTTWHKILLRKCFLATLITKRLRAKPHVERHA